MYRQDGWRFDNVSCCLKATSGDLFDSFLLLILLYAAVSDFHPWSHAGLAGGRRQTSHLLHPTTCCIGLIGLDSWLLPTYIQNLSLSSCRELLLTGQVSEHSRHLVPPRCCVEAYHGRICSSRTRWESVTHTECRFIVENPSHNECGELYASTPSLSRVDG